MIKLFSVKDKQEKEAAAKAAAGTSGPKQSPGEIRLAKDISELTLAKTMGINFPDGAAKITHFVITLKPDEGYYKGGRFVFEFTVPTAYPHEPPKVKCTQKIYHPNVVRISHPTHSASLIGPITLPCLLIRTGICYRGNSYEVTLLYPFQSLIHARPRD